MAEGRVPKAERIAQLVALVQGNPKPMSVRYVYYQMVSQHGHPKTRTGYQQISSDLSDLRWAGKVPIRWFIDETREPMGRTSTRNITPEQAVREAFGRMYVATSVWAEHGLKPALWCESRGTAGMLRRLGLKYEVGIWPCGGLSSITFLADGAASNPTHIGFLADWDDDGQKIRDVVRRDLGRLGCSPDFTDIAITEEQVDEWDYPTHQKESLREQWITDRMELEAIPIDHLTELVEAWILGLLPDGEDTWNDYVERAEKEDEKLDRLKGKIREAVNEVLEDYEEEDDDDEEEWDYE